GNWPYYQCDLTDLDRMAVTLAAIEKDHGLIRVLYNNAGVFHPETDWLDVPPDQCDDTMAANVRVAVFRVAVGGQTPDRRWSGRIDRHHRLDGRCQRQHRRRVRCVQGRRYQFDEEPWP